MTLQAIAKSFGVAAQSYDQHARLQKYAGNKLYQILPMDPSDLVLDLGCGTGYFSQRLKDDYDFVMALDIARSMLSNSSQKLGKEIQRIQADMHQFPILNDQLDLIFSNLVIQWSQNLEQVLNEIYRVLKPGGKFCFSTLLDGTLKEYKTSWQTIDSRPHVNNFYSRENLTKSCLCSGFQIQQFQEEQVIFYHPEVKHLARELKGLGANFIQNNSSTGLTGKRKWQQMSKYYENFRVQNQGLPATYQLLFCELIK